MPLFPQQRSTRRNALQAIGNSLPLFHAAADPQARADQSTTSAPQPRAKSLIIVFCTGAISHHDTFDMKPDSPLEIRGEFKPIQTSVAGTQICEHLPRLAARASPQVCVGA